MLEVSNCSPEMAVPMTVKMPEPITAPMPERGQRPRPEGLFERVLGLLRVADQLVDRLAGKQLAGQGGSPYSGQ